jgi:hypothetical protein
MSLLWKDEQITVCCNSFFYQDWKKIVFSAASLLTYWCWFLLYLCIYFWLLRLDLKLVILPPKCWDCRRSLLCQLWWFILKQLALVFLWIFWFFGLYFFFFSLNGFFFGETRVWTQHFTLVNQVLYCLNHTSSPFCSWLFWIWDLVNYLHGLASNHDPPNLCFPRS